MGEKKKSWKKKNQLQKLEAVVQVMRNTLCDSNHFLYGFKCLALFGTSVIKKLAF